MVNLSSSYLMMIEPKNPCSSPINDDLTKIAQKIFKNAKARRFCRGFHVSDCGQCSDNGHWILPGNIETNSLLVHYVSYHRNEIPVSELDKLREIAHNLNCK